MSSVSVDDDVTVGKFYATFLIQDYFRSNFLSPYISQNLWFSSLSSSYLLSCSKRTLPITMLITIIGTMLRRFKKKKENKALTEAPTDKSTVFQASPSL